MLVTSFNLVLKMIGYYPFLLFDCIFCSNPTTIDISFNFICNYLAWKFPGLYYIYLFNDQQSRLTFWSLQLACTFPTCNFDKL